MAASPPVCILTPLYNAEKFLAECIESVIGQTYTDWEYIIVNNRSTDRSLQIALDYAAKDRRIRVEDCEEFVPAIANFNRMMRFLTPESKYCKVVHADDWLFPTCMEEMVLHAESHPSVGVVASYVIKGSKLAWEMPYPSHVVDGREIGRKSLLGGHHVFGTPSTIIVRSSMVRERNDRGFYNEKNIHTDTDSCYDLLRTTDFGYVHQVLTYSRLHDSSITSFSDRLNTYMPGHVRFLLDYGRDYLTESEYRRCLTWRMQTYQAFLVESFFRRRDKAFFDYHREQLRDMGYPFSLIRSLGAPFAVLLNKALRCYPRKGSMSSRQFVVNLSHSLTSFSRKGAK